MVPLGRGLCFAAFQGFSGRYDRKNGGSSFFGLRFVDTPSGASVSITCKSNERSFGAVRPPTPFAARSSPGNTVRSGSTGRGATKHAKSTAKD